MHQVEVLKPALYIKPTHENNFKNIKEYLRLGVAAFVAKTLAWGQYQILVMMCPLVGPITLNSMIVI